MDSSKKKTFYPENINAMVPSSEGTSYKLLAGADVNSVLVTEGKTQCFVANCQLYIVTWMLQFCYSEVFLILDSEQLFEMSAKYGLGDNIKFEHWKGFQMYLDVRCTGKDFALGRNALKGMTRGKNSTLKRLPSTHCILSFFSAPGLNRHSWKKHVFGQGEVFSFSSQNRYRK